MENFVKYEDITKSDYRNLAFCMINTETHTTHQITLKDLYEAIRGIELIENVPIDIRSQFNVAKNLAVYTWFCYSFHQISELKAYSTLEMALKIKFGNNKKQSFKKLLKKAANSGLIKDRGFSHIADNLASKDSTEYIKKLPDIIPELRNSLAHGSNDLYPYSVSNLRICSDFINQLYSNSIDQ